MGITLEENKIYFFHLSFLKEVNDKWLEKEETTGAAELFMSVVFKLHSREIKELMTCDRTIKELSSKSKYTLSHVPGYVDFISEKSLTNNDNLGDDEYSLKIASLRKIGDFKACFLVSDEVKEKIQDLANEKKYSIKILSPSDFKN